jgi:DNA-binding SARP family transcriptional activator
MHIGLLGSLEIGDGQLEVRLPGRHPRALVAALASEAGNVISIEQLIDTLWAEHPPASARTKLHGYVSAVRKVFAQAAPHSRTVGWPILTKYPGYVIPLNDVSVDVLQFKELLKAANAKFAGNDFAEAAGYFSAALALWRGPALADSSTAVLSRLAETLERSRLLAIERKAQCDLHLGHYDDVAEELALVVSAHPLREGARAALMLALYRRGCRAEALEFYRAGRRILHDELGIEPGAQLRHLHELMLREDPALTDESIDLAVPFAAAPRPLSSPRIRGSRT